MRCDRDIAATLTRLACYKEHLPTGSPLSPILAYFAHLDVWNAIAVICKTNGYTLTVYIDDVTISGASVSAKVLWEVKKEIHRAGHRYHKEKLFVDGPAEITGVMVIGNDLVPPNRQQKKVRESTKALKERLNANAARKLENKLTGLKGQIKQIRAEARLVAPAQVPHLIDR
jgi:signal transduction histidine kinase